jgi:hypothetical protein
VYPRACVLYLGEFDRPFSGKADLVDLLLAFLEEEPARFHIVDPNDQLESKNFSQVYYCEMPAGETTHDNVQLGASLNRSQLNVIASPYHFGKNIR